MKKSGNAKKNVYILITSNKGLCGAFNKNIFKLLAKQNETLLSVIPVGKKGIGFCKKENYPVLKEFIFPEARFYYKFSYNLILELLDKFKKNQITQVKVLYNKNISRITQKAGIEELIPYIPDSEQVKKTEVLKHVCEPNDSFLAERLAFEYMVSKLYYILELSETAEHTSRMNAMENASDNALDLLEELKISYNKARQSEITTEIIEIASAAEALKK
jgi:F-type H+-transporting ATPase subunit gamma